MKSIQKNRKPSELATFEAELKKSVNYASIDTFQALKDDINALIPVQLSLAEEQGYVCCYCLAALKDYEDAHNRERVYIEIEHYKPKSIFNGKKKNALRSRLPAGGKEKKQTDLRIEYTNLLGACQTSNQCGNQKGDTELCYIPNPATTKTKEFPKFGYNFKGKIRSLDSSEERKTTIQKELEDVLGLNNADIRKRRLNRWVGIQRKIKSELKIKALHTGGKREIAYAKELIGIYANRNSNNRYFEFYDCMVYLLQREYKNWL